MKNEEKTVDGLVLWLTRQLLECSLACELPHITKSYNPDQDQDPDPTFCL